MTISQIAASNYAASKTGHSFLFFAFILRHAFGENNTVSIKKILFLFLLTILLTICKHHYLIIMLGFLVTPLHSIGSIRKFALIIVGLLILWILIILIFLTIFIFCVNPIEAAMYICSNLVRKNLRIGVQGRYFMPFAPLFFILFYQQAMTKYFGKSIKKQNTKKPLKNVSEEMIAYLENQSLIQKFSVIQNYYFPWRLISFALFALAYSIIVILNWFSIISC